MMQEQFKPRVHAANPGHPTWAQCGRLHQMTTDNADEVTCGHCMRKIGRDPRRVLADAVEAMVKSYDSDDAPNLVLGHVVLVRNAWVAEQEYIGSRRYYR